MSKKVRKARKRRRNSAETANGEQDGEQTLTQAEQFRFDYAYVVKDLRRVLILALAMFALLIILNIVLQ